MYTTLIPTTALFCRPSTLFWKYFGPGSRQHAVKYVRNKYRHWENTVWMHFSENRSWGKLRQYFNYRRKTMVLKKNAVKQNACNKKMIELMNPDIQDTADRNENDRIFPKMSQWPHFRYFFKKYRHGIRKYRHASVLMMICWACAVKCRLSMFFWRQYFNINYT